MDPGPTLREVADILDREAGLLEGAAGDADTAADYISEALWRLDPAAAEATGEIDTAGALAAHQQLNELAAAARDGAAALRRLADQRPSEQPSPAAGERT